MKEIGRSLPRLEARAKVTGRAGYVHNMRVPFMLSAKIFRSTVAHGKILSLDTGVARDMPGVHSVVTGEDIRKIIPNPYYGPAFHDQPILALDKVRFVGEPVAVVLAEDPHIAEQAVQTISADYEDMEPVFDEVEAMTSSAIVHEALKPAGTFADLKHLAGRTDTNVALDYQLRRGDADAAFARADHVLEHVFRTQAVLHVPLESHASLAEPGHDSIVIHSSTQTPSFVRMEIARLLGWPENRVHVKVPFLGGGFGAKVYVKMEALAAALALLARRPVKIALTMEEQFYTIGKHATTFRIKSGVSKDGRVLARACDVCWNGGAYADIGPRVAQKSGFTAAGPYDIEHVRIDSAEVYTNRPPAGALRGFGIPQLVWAYECHTDLIARELKLDPLEFRRMNILRDGRPQATGTIMKDAAIAKVLERLAELMRWEAPFARGTGTKRRGRGLGIGFKASISPTTSGALVNVSADGSIVVFTNTIDMGQGSDTAMAQIAAEVLNVAAESVRVVHGDTDAAPYDMGTLGSRSTFHMGHAVREAAEDARAKLGALAAELGLPAGTNYDVKELFRKRYGMQAGNVIGAGTAHHPEGRHIVRLAGLGIGRRVARHIGAGGQCDRRRHLCAALHAARCQDRPVGQCDALLDGGRCRRRGRGGHGDRPCARAPAGERRRCRPRHQSPDRQDPDLGRRHHAIGLHALRGHGFRWRPGHQCLLCRLQNSGLSRYSRHGMRVRVGGAGKRTLRRQGRRRIRDLRRVAGDRQCHSRRLRHPADGAPDQTRDPVACAPRIRGPRFGGGLMSEPRTLHFTLNGRPQQAAIATHATLIELLHGLGLFGARESCGQGLCGCCTVLVDGVAVSGCLTLAVTLEGREVTTIEHLDAEGALSAVQQAFVETGAFQCGFCTPGFVLMAEALLAHTPDPSEDEIKHYLSGNLCRCAAYPEIVEAVRLAARRTRK
jgi:CO/xanthine dehydrogenase Mo-binding subunit/aerobic-type carbon monoxide dehydrogenase small subunit (CoxS/CutS family)